MQFMVFSSTHNLLIEFDYYSFRTHVLLKHSMAMFSHNYHKGVYKLR